MRTGAGSLVGLLLAVLVAATASPVDADEDPADPAPLDDGGEAGAVVTVAPDGDERFDPAEVTVETGEVVEFVWEADEGDGTGHRRADR